MKDKHRCQPQQYVEETENRQGQEKELVEEQQSVNEECGQVD